MFYALLSRLIFLLVNFTTPRLSRQPWLVTRREVPGAVPEIWADRIWDGLGPSIYTRDVMYTGLLERFIRLSENWLTFCATVSLPCRSLVCRAVDRRRAVSLNLRWWSETCTGVDESGFWEMRSHDRSRSYFRVFFIYSCTGSTISRSHSCSWYNSDLIDRSVVYLSHLCCFLWSDLDLCNTSVVHVNC
jgi:hypothetical protein